MSEKENANLKMILDAGQKILDYIKETNDADMFYKDVKTFDAVLMNFVVIGEGVIRLSEDFRKEQTDIPWIRIKDFRNLVAHNYFGVDAEEVWQIIQTHIPQLIIDVQKILEKNND